MADKFMKSITFVEGGDAYYPLPKVTNADDGKVLKVVDGVWRVGELSSGSNQSINVCIIVPENFADLTDTTHNLLHNGYTLYGQKSDPINGGAVNVYKYTGTISVDSNQTVLDALSDFITNIKGETQGTDFDLTSFNEKYSICKISGNQNYVMDTDNESYWVGYAWQFLKERPDGETLDFLSASAYSSFDNGTCLYPDYNYITHNSTQLINPDGELFTDLYKPVTANSTYYAVFDYIEIYTV